MPSKKNLCSTGFVIIIAVFLTSCYPGSVIPDPYYVEEGRQKENQYYVKSSPNIPLLTEKKDLSIAGGVSSGSRFTGGEFQAAYMTGKHIGIIGSYTRADNKEYMKFNHFEVGAGYVTQLAKNWHTETYAGFGSSKIENLHYTGHSSMNSTHYFIQPTIAVSNRKRTVQFAFVSRFEGVHFNVKDTTFDTSRELFSTGKIQNLYQEPFHIMWQPGIVFRFGWQKFMFQTAYSYSADLTNADVYGSRGNFSLGAMFRFNVAKKEKM